MSTNFEAEIAEELDETASTAQPDVSALVAGGLRHGRRQARRRRLIVQAVASTAALAAIGGVAYAAPWNSAEAPVAVQNRGSGVTDTMETPAGGNEQVPITPQAALRLVLDQLPVDAKTSNYSGRYFDEGHVTGGRRFTRSAAFVYTDSRGRSRVEVDVAWWDQLPAPYDESTCPPVPPQVKGITCDVKNLDDGSKLSVLQDDSWATVKSRLAILSRPDGLLVTLRESNTLEAKKGGRATRPEPPLTIDQMKAIVSHPAWGRTMEAGYVGRAESLFTAEKGIG